MNGCAVVAEKIITPFLLVGVVKGDLRVLLDLSVPPSALSFVWWQPLTSTFLEV
jgi:hypothetical protein